MQRLKLQNSRTHRAYSQRTGNYHSRNYLNGLKYLLFLRFIGLKQIFKVNILQKKSCSPRIQCLQEQKSKISVFGIYFLKHSFATCLQTSIYSK